MSTEIPMRRALSARHAAFDGTFVHGVVTTTVYWCPSCASRTAKASNVRFFPDPDAAERSIAYAYRDSALGSLVWKLLLRVPEGAVASYGEVAQGIGAPKAVRAAASACTANGIAVLVPCHRVLRGDGGLGGYRWGLDRKRALIDGARRAA